MLFVRFDDSMLYNSARSQNFREFCFNFVTFKKYQLLSTRKSREKLDFLTGHHRWITQRLTGALEKGLVQSVFLVKSFTREGLSLLLYHVKQIVSLKKIRKIHECNHSNEIYQALPFYSAVYCKLLLHPSVWHFKMKAT